MFELLFGMTLEVEEPDRIGETHAGNRRVVGVSGGVFKGPRIRGRVLPGGSDWIVVRRDGVLVQDVRIVLRTESGHDILMSYRGMRHGPEDVMERVNAGEDPDPSEYYFRTAPVFEAPDGEYDWLNKLLAFAVGRRLATGVTYAVYAVS
ncbi:MAG: DUF3237 domain-containing protein [Actinobacteria bacterium]|nr:MAG: DUF3237 domain-containing protein [Actinomycetota bacterium]